jgi:hypothetical protein
MSDAGWMGGDAKLKSGSGASSQEETFASFHQVASDSGPWVGKSVEI